MKINSIHIEGLKGLYFHASNIGRIAHIEGRNRLGKTTILDALVIASLGRLPSVSPKENTQTQSKMKTLGGDSWGASISTADATASYKIENGLVDHQNPGNLPAINPMASSEFMGLSGPAKVQAVIAVADLSKFAPEWTKISGSSPDNVEATGTTIYDQITSLLDGAKARQKALKSVMANTAQLIKPGEPRKESGTITDLSAELEKAKTKQADMQTALRSYEQTIKVLEKVSAAGSTEDHEISLEQALPQLDAANKLLAFIDSQIEKVIEEGRQLGQPQQLQPLKTRKLKIGPGTKCDRCGADSAHWDQGEPEDTDAIDAANAAIETANEEIEAANAAISKKRAELADKSTKLSADKKKALADQQSTQATVNDIQANIRQSQAVVEAMPEKPTFGEDELMSIASDIQAIEQDLDQARALDSEWDRYETNSKERLVLSEQLDKLAALIKSITAFSKTLSAAVFGQILGLGNRIAEATLGITYQWQSNDIVTVKDGQIIKHDLMSGSEKALLAVTLNLGLQLQSGVRMVILDEAAVLDPSAATKFNEATTALVEEGQVDQVLILRPTDGELQIRNILE